VIVDWQWAFNQGLSVFLVLVAVAASWRFFIGTKNKPGYLDRHADAQLAERRTHQEEQTTLGAAAKDRGDVQAANMLTLVADRTPPGGPAYIAAQQVAQTADNVERFKIGMMQSVKIFRRLAAEFPTATADLNKLCDEMEQKIGEV
jgi:hypothetical protein